MSVEIKLRKRYRSYVVKLTKGGHNQAGKHRIRKRYPNNYDPTKHVLVVGPTGKARMRHYE